MYRTGEGVFRTIVAATRLQSECWKQCQCTVRVWSVPWSCCSHSITEWTLKAASTNCTGKAESHNLEASTPITKWRLEAVSMHCSGKGVLQWPRSTHAHFMSPSSWARCSWPSAPGTTACRHRGCGSEKSETEKELCTCAQTANRKRQQSRNWWDTQTHEMT